MFNLRRSAPGWMALFACTATAAAAEPQKVVERWALLVGVDDYAYAQKLQYCGADQRALRDQLIAAGFPKEHVFLLEDKAGDPRLRPSKANIERHVELILNLADAEDLVVIGFSGHGVHLAGKSFLCPGDCNLERPDTLVGVDDIYDRLSNCAAQFKLVLVDACRNDPRPGGTRSMTATDGTRALARTLQQLKLPEGVVLLNSCAPGEVSWEDEKFGHGVFMHYVINGLKGAADKSGDGHVSLHELQAYAGTNTKTYVANEHRVAQRPFFKGDLTTEALEYALLPVPRGVKPKVDSVVANFVPAPGIGPHQLWLGAFIDGRDFHDLVVRGVLDDGPAAKAGMIVGDRLLGIDGKKVVSGLKDLSYAVGKRRPDDALAFEIDRRGQRLTLSVRLERQPSDAGLGRFLAVTERKETWAMIQIGCMYRDAGQGEEAASWFQRAAAAGDASGFHWLGRLYQNGRGVLRDGAKAAEYFEEVRARRNDPIAADHYADATFLLSLIHASGINLPKNLAKSHQLLREAADAGSRSAMVNLGTDYQEGRGVQIDLAKALESYQQAARDGCGAAEYNIGLMIYSGRGVQKDYGKAFGWFETAAEHFYADAMLALGTMYEKGEGVPRNLAKATEWYRKAADLGQEEAKKKLQ